MLGHNTPADAEHTSFEHLPDRVVEFFAQHPRIDGRARWAAIHLRHTPGELGEEGYGTRVSLSVHHNREGKSIDAYVSLDEHRPASKATSGLESVRMKIGKTSKTFLRVPCPRYSERLLKETYLQAIEALRANPEILTDLARTYES